MPDIYEVEMIKGGNSISFMTRKENAHFIANHFRNVKSTAGGIYFDNIIVHMITVVLPCAHLN